MKINISKESRPHVIGFGIFSLLLLGWFIYASLTGWSLFNGDDKRQSWNSSGPGYHK